MKRILSALLTFLIAQNLFSQCTVNATIPRDTIVCGQSIFISAFGQGQGVAVLTENFNNGTYGPGWAATQQAMWNNPCSPNGVDGTTHIWMGNSSPVPRILTTTSFNLSSCTNAGVTICFDMLFATQGNSAPCEGPDEPQEGVYLQYSTDNGATWTTIHYFDPNGGNDPQLVNWNNWCFPVPSAALTANVKFRWYQDADSGADYDHWGIDNVAIYCNDPTYSIVWPDGYNAGPVGGTNPTPVAPHSTTTYVITMSNGTTTCADSVTVVVVNPTIIVDAGSDTSVCSGTCATLHATAKVIVSPAKTPTYFDNTVTQIATVFGQSSTVNVNVTGMNETTVQQNTIAQVCLNNVFFFGGTFLPPGPVDISDLILTLYCPGGDSIILIPAGVTTGGSNPLTGGYTNTCFVPAGPNISTGTSPYTGSWAPGEPFSNLAGCPTNGVWTLSVRMNTTAGFGSGTFSGWSITFNDPEISYNGGFTWTPTTGMTNSTTLNPTVCPPPTDYTITSSDTAGCVTRSDVVHVGTHSCCNFTASATATQASCGASDGTVDVTPVPAGGYTYAWSDGPSTSPNRTGLAPGTYSVTITDQNGCSTIATATVSAAGGPTVITTTTTTGCGTSTGSATATVTSGTASGYEWSNGASGATASNLAAGTYTVTVTAVGGCSTTATATVVSTGGPTITTSTTPTGCNTSTGSATVTVTSGTVTGYLWSNGAVTATASNLAAGTYTVTASATGGCSVTATATVAATGGVSISVSSTNATCGASNGTATVTVTQGTATGYAWSNGGSTANITNLPAGTITVTVTDAGGCTATASATITNSGGSNVTITTDKTLMCSEDSAHVCAPTGYVAYAWNNGGSTECIYAVQSGNYYVTVTDNTGCTATSNHLAVNFYPQPPVSLSVNGDSLFGYNSLSYQWYKDGVLIPGAGNPLFVATQSGSYTVLVADENGCTSMSLPVVITVTGIGELQRETMSVYPNPNNGDIWNLSVSKGWLGAHCEIFDVEGRLVFNSEITDARSEISLNVARGTYMLRVTSGSKSITQKLVKM